MGGQAARRRVNPRVKLMVIKCVDHADVDRAYALLVPGGLVGAEGAVVRREGLERAALRLDAEVLDAAVRRRADGAVAGGVDAEPVARHERHDFAVDVEFAIAVEDAVQLLVGLVLVDEGNSSARQKLVDRDFATGQFQGVVQLRARRIDNVDLLVGAQGIILPYFMLNPRSWARWTRSVSSRAAAVGHSPAMMRPASCQCIQLRMRS